ncbi:MAG: CinA family protein [Deltaproteobacteria bacterium]|nr:CinA family protein [Deltaproteobacteria bacterium]
MEAVVGGALAAAGLTLATAESCTGGLVGHLVTAVPGSSACYLGGVVAYSNAAKERLLGVPGAAIAAHGAVSREVVAAMAEGAARAFGASLGVAVSGVAGPGGGTEAKPVGTVWIGVAGVRGTGASLLQLKGTRAAIRHAAAIHALDAVRREVLGLPGRGGGAERGTGGT